MAHIKNKHVTLSCSFAYLPVCKTWCLDLTDFRTNYIGLLYQSILCKAEEMLIAASVHIFCRSHILISPKFNLSVPWNRQLIGSLTTGDGNWPLFAAFMTLLASNLYHHLLKSRKTLFLKTGLKPTNDQKPLLQRSTSHGSSKIHSLCNTSEPRWTYPQHLSHKIIQKEKQGLNHRDHVFSMPFVLSRVSGRVASVFFQEDKQKIKDHSIMFL